MTARTLVVLGGVQALMSFDERDLLVLALDTLALDFQENAKDNAEELEVSVEEVKRRSNLMDAMARRLEAA